MQLLFSKQGLEDEKSGDVELERKRAEHEIMNQINTNWMILYLYGNRRLFNNPCICSHYCELRLPVLLRSLFHDEEELEDLRVDISWLFSLAQLGDESDLPTTDFNRLCAACTQELDKISSPEWNEQLAEYIFDPSMWEDTSLKASSTEFQTQIDVINALINKAHTLWEQYRKVNGTPSMIVRAMCIPYLFNPIRADLDDYLETASSLDMCWDLFGQLREWLALYREDIDSDNDKPSAP